MRELIKTEFKNPNAPGGVDLNISVYEVAVNQIVQAYAEHCASFVKPTGRANIDLAGRALSASEGGTNFQFTRDTHREMKFDSVEDLEMYLTSTVLPSIEARSHVVTKEQARGYAIARRDAGDPEWLAFFETRAKWP